VAGPYVKEKATITTRYTTVNVLKTIETILNMEPMGLNDALAQPMTDVFDITSTDFEYKAKVPNVLYETKLKLPKRAIVNSAEKSIVENDKNYWVKAMKNQNFESEDKLNVEQFNQALWRGIKGTNAPVN